MADTKTPTPAELAAKANKAGGGGEAKPFTFESEEAANAWLNKAFTGRAKELKTSFAKEMEEREAKLRESIFADVEKKSGESLQTYEARVKELIAGGGGAAKPQGGGAGAVAAETIPDLPDNHPFMQRLKQFEQEQAALKKEAEEAKKKADGLQKRADAEQKAREKAEQESRAQSLEKRTLEALTEYVGIPAGTSAELAFDHLMRKGRVRYSDNGKGTALVFVTGEGDEQEEQDLATGLKQWRDTAQAKHFIPARKPGGGGSRPSGGSNMNNGSRPWEQDVTDAVSATLRLGGGLPGE